MLKERNKGIQRGVLEHLQQRPFCQENGSLHKMIRQLIYDGLSNFGLCFINTIKLKSKCFVDAVYLSKDAVELPTATCHDNLIRIFTTLCLAIIYLHIKLFRPPLLRYLFCLLFLSCDSFFFHMHLISRYGVFSSKFTFVILKPNRDIAQQSSFKPFLQS